MAESRSLPSSPATHEGDQLRSTPSKRAPVAAIAPRDRSLRVGLEVDADHAQRDLRERRQPGSLLLLADVIAHLSRARHPGEPVGGAALLGRVGQVGHVAGRQRLEPHQRSGQRGNIK
jgi:hypothetical protein